MELAVELPAENFSVAADKPSYGLEDLPSLRNMKSRFESGDNEDDLSNSGPIRRSDSIVNKMAKFQNVDGHENGHYDESDSESTGDGEHEETGIIKESRRKEKLLEDLDAEPDVAFQGMSDLKSQWETMESTKEDKSREKQEELNKLRLMICHGKKNLKALYENALDESSQPVSRSNTIIVEGGERAQSIRQRFETGELNGEAEEERYESLRREKEEELSVVKEPAIANDARHLFKQIDAEVARSPVSTGLTKSPTGTSDRWARQLSNQSSINEADIIRPSENTADNDVVVETRDVSARFRFFENYTDIEKEKMGQERKRFTMTPPRELTRDGSPDPEVVRDPNIVRSGENQDEIIVTDTARKMLNKFRELEIQAEREEIPQGPKPVKRITPPREFTREDDEDSRRESPPRDPNIVRACDKVEDEFMNSAVNKAKSLRAKFEHWEEDTDVEKENRKNAEELDQEIQPDRAKFLRAQFESLQNETNKSQEKVKPKTVNRFVQETETCAICNKRVYAMEKIEASGQRFHKTCFKCSVCGHILRLDNFTTSDGILYCTPHFMQRFISRGNYDEGFGRGQHKNKWSQGQEVNPSDD